MNTKVLRLLLPLVALTVSGCKCKSGGTTTDEPDFEPSPTALSFSACPSKDETGMAVADVFPDREILTIANMGKAGSSLTLTLGGTDAAEFSLDPMNTPMSIDPGSSVTLPVLFSPTKKGDSKGTLTIDDDDMTTMSVVVALVGTGINLPSQPTVQAAIESYATPGDFSEICMNGSPLLNCQQAFPDTLDKDSSTLHIKLENVGCPALKITSIDLEKAAGGADDDAFFLDSPTALPTATNPIIMSSSDGTSTLELTIRFSPNATPTGDTQRFATLTLTTNDPATPMLKLSLAGNGLAPDIYAAPTFCNFSDPHDPCNSTGPKVANTAVFTISNGGTSAVTIDSAQFKSTGTSASGSNGRFTVASPIDGQMILPGNSVSLTVAHNDQPLFVIDTITVSASAPAMAPGSAGKIFLTVEGGTTPCLATDPVDTLNFDDAGTVTVEQVTIKALATTADGGACGNLILNSVAIDPNAFFTLIAPIPDAGTTILPGSSIALNVQYTKPVTGGSQAVDLTIESNDPNFAGPSWKGVLLQSNSALNQVPVAVLKGCLPDCSGACYMNTMSVHLSTDFSGAMKSVALCAGDSYDPGNTSSTPISGYKFVLTSPPGSAGLGLDPGTDDMFITSSTNHANLDPSLVGTYKVYLQVKDDTGQPSGGIVQLQINAYQ